MKTVNVQTISISSIEVLGELESYLPPLDLLANKKLIAEIEGGGIREPLSLAELDGRTILLDGHNRLRIAKQLSYTTVPAVFYEVHDLTEAKQRVLTNQLSKRNLSVKERSLLVLKLEPELAAAAAQRKRLGNEEREVVQKCAPAKTIEKLARLAETSRETVRKVRIIQRSGIPILLTLADTKLSSEMRLSDKPRPRRLIPRPSRIAAAAAAEDVDSIQPFSACRATIPRFASGRRRLPKQKRRCMMVPYPNHPGKKLILINGKWVSPLLRIVVNPEVDGERLAASLTAKMKEVIETAARSLVDELLEYEDNGLELRCSSQEVLLTPEEFRERREVLLANMRDMMTGFSLESDLDNHPDNGRRGTWLVTGIRHSCLVNRAGTAQEALDKALASGEVGEWEDCRVAFVDPDGPDIVPVN